MRQIASLLRDSLRSYRHARTTLLATIFLLAALAVLPCVAAAQGLYGTLNGTVTDKSGAVVPNVSVTVTNQGTGAARTANTGPQGDYQFTDLLPGTYTIS